MTTTIRFLGAVYCLGATIACTLVALTTAETSTMLTMVSLAVACFYGASSLATERW